MLEKPNIPDELIISRVQQEYEFHISELTFLPIGADLGTAVYRVAADDGTAFFLKLRQGFEETTVTIPLFLKSQGVEEIIAPVETKSNRGWVDFGQYAMILYPFIEGKDGFEMDLTAGHRHRLGAALNRIHTAQLPAELRSRIPIETFDPSWRDILKGLQRLIRTDPFEDPTAAKLAEFMQMKESEISQLIERAEALASDLISHSLDLVLCHTDIHGGNILIGRDRQLPVPTNNLFIVDWDNPLLAPKERDLMFIGGGIDNLWKGARQQAAFYDGYGKTTINQSALAYYRYERIVEDLAVVGEQILLSEDGGADRERSYGWFTSNFDPRGTIEIARNTDLLARRRD